MKSKMGDIQAFAPHKRWSACEVDALTLMYRRAPWDEILAALPGRTRRITMCKANLLGLIRDKPPKMTPDEVRAAKRAGMAAQRAADPEGVRARDRKWVSENRERLNAVRRKWHEVRFFYVRAKRMRGVSASDLARIWKQQRGLCALTGQRLDRTAELDHKMPKCRGGTNARSNLQWVTHAANFAKRDMTVEEFHALCVNCARWVGERIAMVDAIGRPDVTESVG